MNYKNAEPMGRTGPKFSTASIMQAFVMEHGSSFALLCPAQAFPAPNFK